MSNYISTQYLYSNLSNTTYLLRLKGHTSEKGGVIPSGLLELLARSYRSYGVMGLEGHTPEMGGVIPSGLLELLARSYRGYNLITLCQ